MALHICQEIYAYLHQLANRLMLTSSIAVMLAAILITSIPAFTIIITVNALQQGSDGGLTVTLNAPSYTMGDRVTVSGTGRK
jgi:hypothetical protein